MTSLNALRPGGPPSRPVDWKAPTAPSPGVADAVRAKEPARQGPLAAGALRGAAAEAKPGLFSAVRAGLGSETIGRLAAEWAAEIHANRNPEDRPVRELQEIVDPKSKRALGTVTRHPRSFEEAGQQIVRALKATRPGKTPVILNLSERKDHPPGVTHCPDHFPPGVAVPIGPHHSVMRREGPAQALGHNAQGEPMQARVSTLSVTDSRTGRKRDVQYIDVEKFSDGSTPPDAVLRKILELLPKGSPLVVNCEAGIGRSAMLWLIQTLRNEIDEANTRGEHYGADRLMARARELAKLVRDERGEALLPDLDQNAAVMRVLLGLLENQSVPAPAPAPQPSTPTTRLPPGLPAARRVAPQAAVGA